MEYILVDGLDGTDKAINLLENLGPRNSIALLDGVTYAGFNYIDPYRIYRETSTPVIVFYRHRLSLERIKNALYKNFDDAWKRYSVIEKCLLDKVSFSTQWGIYEYTAVGIDVAYARELITQLELYSPEPEPLRIADIIASKTARLLYENNKL